MQLFHLINNFLGQNSHSTFGPLGPFSASLWIGVLCLVVISKFYALAIKQFNSCNCKTSHKERLSSADTGIQSQSDWICK